MKTTFGINCILFILEIPFAYFLSFFTLGSRETCISTYNNAPLGTFFGRFLIAFVPILIVSLLLQCCLKLIIVFFKKECFTNSFKKVLSGIFIVAFFTLAIYAVKPTKPIDFIYVLLFSVVFFAFVRLAIWLLRKCDSFNLLGSILKNAALLSLMILSILVIELLVYGYV